MGNTRQKYNGGKEWVRRTLGLAGAVGILSVAGWAHAQGTVTMAPPIQGANSNDVGDVPDNASQDTVFNWREVPTDQRVTITRAVFDKGGYQLYDNVGETIVVPFSRDNLYVMKFGVSNDGSTYFVNDGSEPTLYLPHNGYLENATVTGGRWYPFPHDYRPAEPVYLGIAPSWPAYLNMGWYPDMSFYGGYYCRQPFEAGAVVFPTFGLFINIGDQPYYGWTDYRDYCEYHPAPYHVQIVNTNIYRWGGQPAVDNHDGGWHNPDLGGGGRTFQGGDRTFGNVSGGVRPFGGARPYGGDRNFGADGRPFVGSHTFRGGPGFDGGGHGIGGGDRAFGENPGGFGAGNRTFGNGNPGGFGSADHGPGGFGGNSNQGNAGPGGFGGFGGGNRTFGNVSGGARPFGGFGGAQPAGGGGFGGGANHSFGGGAGGGGGGHFGGGQFGGFGGGGGPHGGGHGR